MSKRWYVLLCLLALLLSPQLAAAVPSISIGNVTGVAGQNATVTITLSNAGTPSEVASLSLQLAYDPRFLSAAPTFAQGQALITAGVPLAAPQINSVDAGKSTVNMVMFDFQGVAVPIQDGVLVTMTFPLQANAAGTTPIIFNVPPEVNNALGEIPATSANGGITVADTTAPVVGTFTLPATSSSLTVAVSALAATDNVGVTGYLITESATAPLAGAAGWSATAPTSFTFTSEGAKTLRAWAKDAAGNVSAATTATVTVTLPDTTRPTVGAAVSIPTTSTSLTVAVTGFTATDNVAVTGYLLTETSGLPAADAAGWSATPQTSFTFSAGGARTLYAWAKDAAGNISFSVSKSITINLPDAVAPSVTAFTVAASSTSLTVPVTGFTATDNTQVAGYLVTESATTPAAAAAGWSTTAPTSYTVTGTVPQGAATDVTLYGWAKDAAGNISAAVSGVVAITLPDTTKPVVGTFTVPATAETAVVSVTLTATDNLAVTGYLITESATAPAAAAAGWTTSAPTSYSFIGLPQGVSNVTLYGWAKDAAGNVSLGSSAAITVTLTGPTISFTNMLTDGAVTKNTALTIAGTVSGNGTALSTLTLSVNDAAAEPFSSFDTTTGEFSTTIVLVEGANKLVVAATDANNNVSTDTRTITLNPLAADLAVTAPTTGSFTTNSLVDVTGTVGSPQTTTVTVALNGGDAAPVALNGDDSFTYQLTLVKGVNSIVVTATDSVTGPHTQTIQVTFDPDAPVLSVSSPADAFATPKSSFVLTGALEDALTTPALFVTVDGVALATQPTVTDGAFSVTIELPSVKTYAVTVTATDQSGNSSSITRNVIRKDPSGNATDGISAATIADVQKVLQFALGLSTPSADETINVDVAPLVNGKPAPDGNVDGGDALVILEKIVGIVAW